MSSMLTDELGQSFQINADERLTVKNKECIFANINTVNSIADFVRTSLGPTGMDKIIVDQDGRVIVTNDGATIIREMEMSQNPVSQLIQQLSQSQDEEIGDGTTSVVVLAAGMLKQAKKMIEKGMHPIKIAEGYTRALEISREWLQKISEPIVDLDGAMIKAARTSLSSKIVCASNFAEICVRAVQATYDYERHDLDLDMIQVESMLGGALADTQLFHGIILKKVFSHPQMLKEVSDAQIALLSCPFEPPKLKTKSSLLIRSAEEYWALDKYEKEKFEEMVSVVRDAGANVVLCQWGFDDEANSLLLRHGISAVRWVGGHELGLISAHIGAQIISVFGDLRPEWLGEGNIREMSVGTEKIIVVSRSNKNDASKGAKGTANANRLYSNCSTNSVDNASLNNLKLKSDRAHSNCVTILVRGSTEHVIEEAKRSIHDAICSIRNLLVGGGIVYGGGSCEISLSLRLVDLAKNYLPETEEAIRAFADALLEIPLALAYNSGFDSFAYIEKIREIQIITGDSAIGVDCLETGEKNMRKSEVFESLKSKLRQIEMATELVCMILKINDVIHINDK